MVIKHPHLPFFKEEHINNIRTVHSPLGMGEGVVL